ncbi:MAG: competence/damage-inducible protein A [Acidobacteria bacterium]|nr:competence/damage-inducible protein A [Acidobacteriota bacterium]
MEAVIIAVGSELLTPARLDTNSLFLTERLARRGVEVIRKIVVGDNLERIAAEIRRGREEAHIVIVTGGLGPTLDDLSREGAAAALGVGLVEQPELVAWLEERFASFGRKMAANNRRQALILEGAEPLPNPNGTAPGQYFADGGGVLMLLPGPPREIKPMFTAECEPRLSRIHSPYQYSTVTLRVSGLGESDVDQRVGPIYSAESRADTTILAGPGDIQLHVRGKAATADEARQIAHAVAEKMAAELGDNVYAWEDKPLEAVVGDLLRERGLQLGLAESCTGGLIAERITDVPGSSEYFAGGFVSYSERAKVLWLGVSASLIAEHGMVSEPTARAMAERARDHAGGPAGAVGVAVTGVAGPGPDAAGNPQGLVCMAVADEADTVVFRREFRGGGRDRVRQLAAQYALDLLRRRLLGLV